MPHCIKDSVSNTVEDKRMHEDEISFDSWKQFSDNPHTMLKICHMLLSKPTNNEKRLSQIYTKRAEAFVSLNNLSSASSDLNIAERLDPDFPRVYLIRARIALLNCDFADARAAVVKVIGLEPENAEAKAMYQKLSIVPAKQVDTVVPSEMSLTLLSTNKSWSIPKKVLNRGCPFMKTNTIDCRERLCSAARMDMEYVITDINNPQIVLEEASSWINQYYKEKNLPDEKYMGRMIEVETEIRRNGTYKQTYDELNYACKVGWRNAPRCINRIQWSRMEIIDCRDITTAEGVFEKCVEHLRVATNGGNVITTVTVFAPQAPGRPAPRIWNSQLLRYAAYKQADGSIIGDPANLELTEAIQKLGWTGPGNKFDILPLVVQMPGEDAKLFEIPKDAILSVKMQHPNFTWFKDLNLEWVAVPFVSNIGLTAGGIQYTCLPFNGWFMGTELSRNLGDQQRYNMLPTIASKMGIDPNGPPSSMWQEKANIELNTAILYSFQMAKVSMVDHHTAASGFLSFWDAEHSAGRAVAGDWVWLVPPVSGAASPLFHLEMTNFLMKPAYYPMDFPGKHYNYPKSISHRKTKLTFAGLARTVRILLNYTKQMMEKRHKVTVLYATETGNSERFALRTAKFLARLAKVRVLNMENYNLSELPNEEVFILVASTFGSGDPPSNGISFKDKLKDIQLSSNVHFSVFGLGSTLYETFGAFGEFLNNQLEKLGATRINPLIKGDEITGNEAPYKQWIEKLWYGLFSLWGFKKEELEEGLSILGVKSKADTNKFISNYKFVKSSQVFNDSVPTAPFNRSNPFVAKIKDNTDLLKNDGRSVRKIVLDTSNSGFQFSPGDHIAVLPSNSPEHVQELIEVLNIENADEIVEFKPLNENSALDSSLSSQPFSLRKAFSNLIDITCPPKPNLLEILAHFANDEQHKEKLHILAQGKNEYNAWIQQHNPTIVETIQNFPVRVPIELLLETLPLLQPRFYSISCSPKTFPNEIHITVGIVDYNTPSGKQRLGVASNFLSRTPIGSNIKMYLRKSEFLLPSCPSVPIILVGPGTGISPFRSFWQERAHLKGLGKAFLFFGCRSRGEYLYEEEIKQAIQEGHLSDVLVAFSRENNDKKNYVQDLLEKESNLVWELLNKGAIFYVCGDPGMARGVKESLSNIALKHGEDGSSFVENLIKSKRYLSDVFGTHPRKVDKERAL